MAKALFISLNDLNAEGIRTLSAKLSSEGHEPHIVFLKRPASVKMEPRRIEREDWIGVNERMETFRYARGPGVTEREKELLAGLISEIAPKFIGMSVTTPLKRRAAEITGFIKENFGAPVVWGGAGATMEPRECLSHCDYVCIGEGEESICGLAEKADAGEGFEEVSNLAYIKNGAVSRNAIRPPIEKLDNLPFKDISPERKYLIENGALTRNFAEISYSGSYHMISGRGCPFSCSYCCEEYYRRLYEPRRFLRRRSPGRVIEEIRQARRSLGFSRVHFEDEVFSTDYNWLKRFKELYVREIGLPFVAYIHIDGDIERRLALLREAGLTETCLALQSGSPRINRDIFNRYFDRDLFISTAHLLKRLDIRFYVDVITYNPFEEEADLRATLEALSEVPKPFNLCVNKLNIFPGVRMHELAMREKREAVSTQEKRFDLYVRLFWLTRLTPFYGKAASLMTRIGLFRRFPSLVKPRILNAPFKTMLRMRRARTGQS